MTNQDLDISVVICAYTEERWDDLVAAVESVKHQSIPPRDIIVVVDHNPGLLERVRAHIPGIIVVENKGMPGASSSRNSGVAVIQGSLIAFLDDDAAAEPDWLRQLIMGYENPRVLGVGGALEPVWLGGRPKWFPDEYGWVVGCTYRGMPEEASAVRNLIAANMSVRSEIFDSVGGFRSGYGNVKVGTPSRAFLFRSCDGDEETEFCIQALHRWPQGVWLYMPQARVHHKVPLARANWRYFVRRCYNEGVGKAVLSQFVGTKYGLASERTYVFQILPRGTARGMGDAILRSDVTGLMRAGAIMAGLASTMVGFLVGIIYVRLTNYSVLKEKLASFPDEQTS